MSKWFKKYYRSPRTRNEERHNQDEYEGPTKQQAWCRAKRRPVHLADSWWDKHSCVQKSWKEHRKTKYRPGRRGQKHTLFVDGWIKAWQLKEYCETYDVPFTMEAVRQAYKTVQIPIKKAHVVGKKLIYIERYRKVRNEDGEYVRVKVREPWFYVNEYEYTIEGYRTVTYYKHLGYNCTWWSNKDIGVEYIINKE